MNKLISLGELIDQSWDMYRKRFTELMSISSLMLISALVSIIAFAFIPNATKLQSLFFGAGELTQMETAGFVIAILNNIVIGPIIAIWVFAGLALFIHRYVKRRSVPVKDVLKQSWKYFFPIVLVTVLFSLILLTAPLIGIGPAYLVGWLADMRGVNMPVFTNLLIVLGVIVSLVIFLRWFAVYFMAGYAVIIDDKRGWDALRQSRALTEGRFWSFALRLVIPKLLYVGVSFVLLFLAGFIVNLLVTAASGLNVDLQLRLSTMGNTIAPIIVGVLINPLIIATDVLLYDNLKQHPVSTPKKHQSKTSSTTTQEEPNQP